MLNPTPDLKTCPKSVCSHEKKDVSEKSSIVFKEDEKTSQNDDIVQKQIENEIERYNSIDAKKSEIVEESVAEVKDELEPSKAEKFVVDIDSEEIIKNAEDALFMFEPDEKHVETLNEEKPEESIEALLGNTKDQQTNDVSI